MADLKNKNISGRNAENHAAGALVQLSEDDLESVNGGLLVNESIPSLEDAPRDGGTHSKPGKRS